MASLKASDSFRKAAQSFLGDERFSDFTVVCGEKEYKVHRCFLAAHSTFFELCCGGPFQEAGTRKVQLKEDDPNTVAQMLRFIYACDYDDTVDASGKDNDAAKAEGTNHIEDTPAAEAAESIASEAADSDATATAGGSNVDTIGNTTIGSTTAVKAEDTDTQELEENDFVSPLDFNAAMYAVADKYGIEHLKALALEKFKAALGSHCRIAHAMIGAIRVVHGGTPPAEVNKPFRDLLVEGWLMGNGVLQAQMVKTEFEKLLVEVPTFSVDLNKRLLTSGFRENDCVRLDCAQCGRYEDELKDDVLKRKLFKCKKCGPSISHKGVKMQQGVTMEAFWSRD